MKCKHFAAHTQCLPSKAAVWLAAMSRIVSCNLIVCCLEKKLQVELHSIFFSFISFCFFYFLLSSSLSTDAFLLLCPLISFRVTISFLLALSSESFSLDTIQSFFFFAISLLITAFVCTTQDLRAFSCRETKESSNPPHSARPTCDIFLSLCRHLRVNMKCKTEMRRVLMCRNEKNIRVISVDLCDQKIKFFFSLTRPTVDYSASQLHCASIIRSFKILKYSA